MLALALPGLAFAQVYYYSTGNFIGAYAPNASSGYGYQLPPAAQQAISYAQGMGGYGTSYPSYSSYGSGYGSYYPSYSGYGYGSGYNYSPSTYSYGSGGNYVPCSSNVGGMCGQDTQIGLGAALYNSLYY